MNNLTLYTCAGGLQVINLPQFAPRVAWQIIDQHRVSVPIQTFSPAAASFGEMPDPFEVALKRADYDLKPFLKVSYAMQMVAKEEHKREMLFNYGCKFITEEFKILVAQKTPEFFLKDLNMESIEELAVQYASAMGDSDPLGVQINLGKYQRFFVICNSYDFKFFCCESQDLQRGGHHAMGKLVNINPSKVIMGRYENSTFMTQITAQQMQMNSASKAEQI